jgi:hypothetical protein
MSVWAMLGAAAARGRRVPRAGWATLNSKIGPVGFYKGSGIKATGRHTRKGRAERRVCVYGVRVLGRWPWRDAPLGRGGRARERAAARCGLPSSTSRSSHTLSLSLTLSSTLTGAYQVLPERRPRYIVPDLSACEVG